MNILHVEAGMHLYGGALQVVFLLRGLQERGVHSTLVCPDGSAIAQAAAPFADVVTMKMGGDLDVGVLPRLRRIIAKKRPDLVHLHSRRGIDWWGAFAARSTDTPVVLSRRVDNPEPSWLARRKYGLYDRVVTISRGIERVLLAEGVPGSRIACVPSAVDTRQYAPASEDRAWFDHEFDVPPGWLTIGMVAQFIARKGHGTMLDALPALLDRHPRVRVLMFGQGPLWSDIKQQVQVSPLLARHVSLPGFRNDLARVLPHLDVVAHPAFMEGLGVSLLQAAACAVPIVGGRAGGIPEIVQPGINGELVEPGNAAELAGKLDRLLSSPELRRQYGAAGRSLAERHFSIPAMVDGNLAVYQSVLTQSQGRN